MEDNNASFELAMESRMLAWARPKLGLVAKEVSGIAAYIWLDENIVKFPPSLSSDQRLIIHTVATKLGLLHKSTGSKNNRCVSVFHSSYKLDPLLPPASDAPPAKTTDALEDRRAGASPSPDAKAKTPQKSVTSSTFTLSADFEPALEARLQIWANRNLEPDSSAAAKAVAVQGVPEYVFSADERVAQFPASLDAAARCIVHVVADRLGLKHKSSGGKKNRVISVFAADEVIASTEADAVALLMPRSACKLSKNDTWHQEMEKQSQSDLIKPVGKPVGV